MSDINTIVQKEAEETEAVLSPIRSFTIRSAPDLEKATAFLKEVAAAKKKLTATKEEITKPINESLKNIRALFAPLEEKLGAADQFIRGKILDWNRKVDEDNRKKEAETIAKVESGEISAEAAGTKLEKLESKKDATPTRKQKVVKVIDETKVPMQYRLLDMVAIRRDALAGVEIAGVEVVVEEIVALR